jgi:hypothetical protein
MIRDAASKQAAIRFDEGGVDGRSAELQARAERNALSFAQDFARMVRLACHRHRLLQFDVNLYALLRDTLNNRAQVLISKAIDRHAPEKEASTLAVARWTEQFTQAQFDAIRKELSFGSIAHEDLEEAYFDMMVTVGWLLSTQVAFISISRANRGDVCWDSLSFGMLLKLLEAANYDMEMMRSIAEKLPVAADNYSPPRADALNARLPGWILTNAGSWRSVLIQLRERLPLELQSEPFSLPEAEPEHWGWLCEDGGSLAICWGQFQIRQAGVYAEYRTRQLSAISACLDDGEEDEEFGDESDIFGSDTSTVACRAIGVPLKPPWASGRPPFSQGTLRQATQARFVLPRSPLVDSNHLKRLEQCGLVAVLRALRDGLPRNLERSLDAFQTARSLGGKYGAIPDAIEQGWRLAALRTCLEQLYGGDRNEIRERVRTNLGDRAAALIHDGFNRRNEQVHGNAADEWADFPGFIATVRRALGFELRRAAM